MHLLMIFSLLSLTAFSLIVASQLIEPDAQPIKIQRNNQEE